MVLLDVRELLPLPDNGANSSDTVINGVHFNRTALDLFNYTFYSNNTLSNWSNCFLVFDQFKPLLLSNGTFINGTSCSYPVNGIKARGSLGLVVACLFMTSVMFTLIHLRKHGRLFLPSEKRFRAVGRRWQWYWLLFVAACGGISGFVSVDIDRGYVLSLPIILQNFFYYLMIPGILAAVWESVRHWGSWQERQIYDRDPFSIPQDSTRGKREFWMPLIFYLFAFLNFFMVIPRSWTRVQYQRTPSQQAANAEPVATDGRFKAAGAFAFLAWCVICYNLRHSIHYYKPRSRGCWQSFNGLLHWTPTKFMVLIPLALLVVGYQLASASIFDISPLKVDVHPAWMYGLGYGPVILVIVVFQIYGYLEPNEDRELIRQRRELGRSVDADLGLNNKKPGWWSKRHADAYMTDDERLRALASEVGGGRPTRTNIERAIEMGHMPVHARDNDPFTDNAAVEAANPPRPIIPPSPSTNEHINRPGSWASTATAQSQQPRVRSMLDV
ncbi:MAG: hypothetical protein M1817_006686 [Caeruleum heppii]|nr:MAG: hypothetical protein M1817_006686 [Caeruleum heppii]